MAADTSLTERKIPTYRQPREGKSRRVVVPVSLTKELKVLLKQEAENQKVSMAALFEDLVRDYFQLPRNAAFNEAMKNRPNLREAPPAPRLFAKEQ